MNIIKVFILFFIIFITNTGASFLDQISDKLNLKKKEQAYGIYGTILCNQKPSEMIKIQLYDKDRNSLNDLMNRQHTDMKGRFNFYGSESEIGKITPLVTIEHQCNVKDRSSKKLEYLLSKDFITLGSVPKTFCNLGNIDLANVTSLTFSGLGSLFSRSIQSVGVKGTFLCNTKPIEKVELELYEKDTFTFNDLMNRASTDLMGRVTFYGSDKEYLTIRPLLEIGHFCNVKGRTSKKIEYHIPQTYINIGEVPTKYCDLGIVELSKSVTIECKQTIEIITSNKNNFNTTKIKKI
ncbi:Transthyretin-like family-containing protein [Strongyloides ratti]|uniref:Transthyretin-like family-containing protein n=1 Tax=Strongyloides ratti TaxID=34506 RepID=A0A090LCZ0_STRRB|nr:Transthyretin-like family-containing protein [Strongyloides ratti]CEF67622.1 Transthyretin-like family-containing protein [Strongyloides ratti]